MHLAANRVEVKHDLLFGKAQALACNSYDVIDVVVQGCLDEEVWLVDLSDVLLDSAEGMRTLLEPQAAPPLLDAVCRSLADDQVERQLFKLLSE